jgi:hypothetical protein
MYFLRAAFEKDLTAALSFNIMSNAVYREMKNTTQDQ